MNLLTDIDIESDVSIDGVSSYPYMGTPNYDVDWSRDLVGHTKKKRSGYSNALSAARQRQLSASARLDNFDVDYNPAQLDNDMINQILGDGLSFGSTESNLLQMLDNLQVSENLLFSRRNLAAVEALPTRQLAEEVLSTRRLAKLYAISAARKEAMLALIERNVSRLSRNEIYAQKKMHENNRVSLDRKRCKSQLRHNLLYNKQKGMYKKRPEHWQPKQEYQNRKRRLCRHFLKGYCKRGRTCDFLHDSSIFCHEMQKVFLGGLPSHISETSLKEKLAEQGYTVVNNPKVLRGFTPQVCLGSVDEAQRMIEKGKIIIEGCPVDVRPYEAFVKENLEMKLPDDIKRSVFLGGIPIGTTGQLIKDELEKLDVKVVNHPLIKTGFSPQVMLGSLEQAKKLVNMKKVQINSTLVDVRPYVNYQVRSSLPNPKNEKRQYSFN